MPLFDQINVASFGSNNVQIKNKNKMLVSVQIDWDRPHNPEARQRRPALQKRDRRELPKGVEGGEIP